MSPWVLYAFLAAVFAGITNVFAKVGIAGVDSAVATTIRGLVIAVFMGSLALYLGRFENLGMVTGRTWFFIVLTGIAGGLSWYTGFLALKLGGEATAVNAIDKLSIVFLLIFAVFFLREALTVSKGVGILFIVFGTLLVSLPWEQLKRLLHLN